MKAIRYAGSFFRVYKCGCGGEKNISSLGSRLRSAGG